MNGKTRKSRVDITRQLLHHYIGLFNEQMKLPREQRDPALMIFLYEIQQDMKKYAPPEEFARLLHEDPLAAEIEQEVATQGSIEMVFPPKYALPVRPDRSN